jgi:hypothetical protein
MSVINHGTWSRYTPDPWPEGLPAAIMFCKRDSDGIDWYEYTNDGASFSPNAVVATVYGNVVTTVNREYARLFPQGALVIEITGDNTTEDPQAAYGGKLYDATANTLTEATPQVPQIVSPRQARLALLAAGVLDQVQAAVDAAGGATKIAWEYATEINRTDPLILSIGAALNFSPEQIDTLFKYAAAQ